MHVGELIVGRYELELLVGEGGMSTVYRAYDTVLERRVAIKVLHEHYSRDPEYVERFRREARAIARLAHPNIVTVIDRGEWEGRQFIVFEHVAGENLKAVIAREGPLPVDQALDLAAQVARALDADDALTATGTVLGTGQYLSPEQASGERGTERSDQYSLGVVTYELLTGRVPYTGDTLMAVAMQHVREPVPSVRALRPEVPERVDAVVARAMAKRPQDRFASMTALAAALESCEAGAVEARGRQGDEKTGVIPPPRPPGAPATGAAAAAPAAAEQEPSTTQGRAGRRSGLRVAAILLLAAVILVGNLLVLEVVFKDGLPGFGGDDQTPVNVEAISDHDPYGDNGQEHPELVAAATDGDLATFWTTEEYRTFAKDGVGIVLDAGSRVALSRVVVLTDTPGFTALIAAADDPGGEFVDVAGEQQASRRTTFDVDTRGESYRYYLVWITDLEGRAHLNEVRASVSG